MRYRTIRVPEWVYFAAVLARSDTLNQGLQSIPAQLREPTVCPRCRSTLKATEESTIECESCGFRHQKVATSGSDLAGVGLGVIIGLGLAAYFNGRKPAVTPSAESAAARAAARRIRRRANESGADRLSEGEIQAEIEGARKQRPRRRRSA